MMFSTVQLVGDLSRRDEEAAARGVAGEREIDILVKRSRRISGLPLSLFVGGWGAGVLESRSDDDGGPFSRRRSGSDL